MSKIWLHETPWSLPPSRRGAGLDIHFAWHDIAGIGPTLLAATPRGLCFLGFPLNKSPIKSEQRLRDTFPAATLTKDATTTASCAATLTQMYGSSPTRGKITPIPLDLYGTPFQLQVWKQLCTIPWGHTVSYQDVARDLGRPSAPRAVGGAVGANPVSILVPCHRVIQHNGDINNYGWGTPIKQKLLTLEGYFQRKNAA